LINEGKRANSFADMKCMSQKRKYESPGISLDRLTRLELDNQGILFVPWKG